MLWDRGDGTYTGLGQECVWHAAVTAEAMAWRKDVLEDELRRSNGHMAGEGGRDFRDLIGLWSTWDRKSLAVLSKERVT